jgi:hypothetical protein
MAILRCEKCGAPEGLKEKYPHRHELAPNPDPLMCGAPNCTRRAVVWLGDTEQDQYSKGRREFRLPQIRTAVKVV